MKLDKKTVEKLLAKRAEAQVKLLLDKDIDRFAYKIAQEAVKASSGLIQEKLRAKIKANLPKAIEKAVKYAVSHISIDLNY